MQRLIVFCARRANFSHRIRYFSSEIDIEAKYFQKGPLDPEAVDLVKSYNDKIVYSSYVERNKRPMRFAEKMMTKKMCEKEKRRAAYREAMRRPFSLALKHTADVLETSVFQEPKNELPKPNENTDENMDLSGERDINRNIIMNESKLEIFREMNRRRNELENIQPKYPTKWMSDYETYDEKEDEDEFSDAQFGTPDRSVPISKVPCHGCGALLQCVETSLPGYLPSELMRNQRDQVLRTLTCQRCHFLKNYNTALHLEVKPEEYVNMISAIKDTKSLVILMVDLVEFPCSIWPGLIDIIGPKRPLFVVGNKVDLLPQDSRKYLNNIKESLERYLIESGFTHNNIQHTCLISAETNYGIEDLITNLHRIWENKGDVYLVGCTNVGKSTLFNALLRSDYCKVQASNIIKRATASIWPGTTLRMLKFPIFRPSYERMYIRTQRIHEENRKLREARKTSLKHAVMTGGSQQTTLIGHLGQTFSAKRNAEDGNSFSLGHNSTKENLFVDDKNPEYADSKWFFDTPGVISKDQIINLLTTEELLDVVPKKTLWPRVLWMKPHQTLFLAGLGRVDYIGGSEECRLAVYASNLLPIMIVETEHADEIYRSCVGTELMRVPRGDEERMRQFPALERWENLISVSNHEWKNKSVCDLVMSSAGWVSVNIQENETASFHVWTPERRGIYVRKPSLLPYGAFEYRGRRIYGTQAYGLRVPRGVRN